ncbi:MAG TPA: hypothetical protein VHM19_13610, partial [Polyangiales bacterium]|nr:hypothetical protein [Polyangiales bacterium]
LAERNLPNAAVFISPTPPAGVRTRTAARFWRGFGVARKLGLVPRALPPNRALTDYLAFNCVPAEHRRAAWKNMVHESREVFADFDTHTIDEARITIPVLTVAAKRDRLVPANLVRLTARKYEKIGGAFKEYADHAHWLYAEPGWEKPAQDILDWVQSATA